MLPIAIYYDALMLFGKPTILRERDMFVHSFIYVILQLVFSGMFQTMMGVLAPIAKFLVTQECSPGVRAGACFNYYAFQPGSTVKQLQALMKEALNEYLPKEHQKTPPNYGSQVNQLIPIEAVVNNLYEIDE